MKPRRLRWAVHVARIGRGGVHTGFWWKNLREGYFLEGSGIDGKIVLKWIFDKRWGAWVGSKWLRIGTGGGLL
jgi:hypothetical protein